MKKLLYFLIFIPVIAFSQQKEEVVNLSGKSAEEMYSKRKSGLRSAIIQGM